MKHLFQPLVAACLLLAGPPSPLSAQGAPGSAALQLAADAEKLRPGQWVWAPKVAPAGPMLIYVDLGRQVATVYRNGVRIGVSTISSGRRGFETPTGVFTILEKSKEHVSRKFNEAKMPYSERLTWSGVTLHAGGLPGYPESHGCVHLPLAFSKILFEAMPMGGTVVIAGGHEDPVTRPAAGVLAPPMAGVTPPPATPLSAEGIFTWTPEASLDGPVSIIISTSDQQVVVLRNGIEIGRAHALVDEQPGEPRVMTYASGATPEWIEVGVSDLTSEPAEIISTEQVDSMHLPKGFVQNIRSIIAPGATVLVTKAKVDPQSTGVIATVLDNEPDRN